MDKYSIPQTLNSRQPKQEHSHGKIIVNMKKNL